MSDDEAVKTSRGRNVKAIRDELEKRSRESGGNLPSPLWPYSSNSGSFIRRSISEQEEKSKGGDEHSEPSQRNLFHKDADDLQQPSLEAPHVDNSEDKNYMELEQRNEQLSTERRELQGRLTQAQVDMDKLKNQQAVNDHNSNTGGNNSSLIQELERKDKEISDLKEMVRQMLNERKKERENNQNKHDQGRDSSQSNHTVHQLESDKKDKQQLLKQLQEAQEELAMLKSQAPNQVSPPKQSAMDFSSKSYKAASGHFVKEIHRLEGLLHQQSKTIVELSGRGRDRSMLDILSKKIMQLEPSAAAVKDLQTFLLTLQDPPPSPPSATTNGFPSNRPANQEVASPASSRPYSEHVTYRSFTEGLDRPYRITSSFSPSSRPSPLPPSTTRSHSEVYRVMDYGRTATESSQRMDVKAREAFEPGKQARAVHFDEEVYLLSV
ncbi:hypothetical protein GUITHDRAFT_110863 [Guillardia theta CCMP2712]|uniref:Uncharacterized protein n=1 Tax=Guillardia theta (strain CCMP2712) TaxID=905079 RepID=L1J3P2_GUITC|nr:hypothetical protein GUITHDRAFT_110863 [Guillardia theta CCMP2712]EKX43136.1 hypothetical protein GUITHDRAFT_110863 [Guillardia theta CCMP2712]|eukprot:XP_005830116.1 hypothetical protein GUITHDRAFT_110863 [Guillardia theta CCMP2712]